MKSATCSECGNAVTNRKSLRDGVCPSCRANPYAPEDQTLGGKVRTGIKPSEALLGVMGEPEDVAR